MRTSVPSSMKTAWPRVSNTTFQDTVKWFTPWIAIALLLAWCTVQFFTYDLLTLPTMWKWIGYLPNFKPWPTFRVSMFDNLPIIESSYN